MSDQAAVATPESEALPEKETGGGRGNKRIPPYHVILWNDDDHSFEYVIDMMKDLFGHQPAKGMQIAETVHIKGRAICLTTAKEHAELKRDQIHAYGADKTNRRCKGSMSASIEPAEG